MFANDYLLELTGWTRAEVVGTNWFDRFIITEKRQAERLKNDLIGIVSHELRSPIGVVRGTLELLFALEDAVRSAGCGCATPGS